MTFLDDIFAKLESLGDATVLRELRGGDAIPVSGRELLDRIARARAFLASQGLKKGDRCALLAHNGVGWIAMDLAIIAEGLIVVPLYSRQAAPELVTMMRDCAPALICCGDRELRDAIRQSWHDAPPQPLFDEIFSTKSTRQSTPAPSDSDPVAIIYTSGTSGEAKGVVLTARNVGHMLGCTSERLDLLMKNSPGQDRVFQWAPLCFAAAWITMLTGLLRGSLVSMNTDLTKIAAEIRTVAPDYFVNVPALL